MNVAEKEVAERLEIPAGSKTSRGDEYHLPIFFQHLGADGHKKSVDIGLPIHDTGARPRMYIVLGKLEVRRIRDDIIILLSGIHLSKDGIIAVQALTFIQDEV